MTSVEDLFEPCHFDGGCRYLRELSRLERLIGCDATAKFYEGMADRCARQGCWALLAHLRDLASPSRPHRSRFPMRTGRPGPKDRVSGAKRRSAEVVPFVRSDVADVVSDKAGNFVERRTLKPGALDPMEPLGYMYEYWRWLRSMTRCQLSNVDTTHLMRAGVVGKLHVVDVGSADPGDFRFELAGYGIPLVPCEKPRNFHVAIYADSVIHDYNTVRLTAAPRLQRVRTHLDRMYYNYVRLILPLFDERRRVSRLLVAFRLDDAAIAKRTQ
jgi:hypothetical protein